MSKKIDDKLYMSDLKEQFLSCYPDSYNQYRHSLQRASKFEKKFNKELSSFNLDELGEYAQDLQITSENGISYIRYIKTYIDFAIEQGWSDHTVNPLEDNLSAWALQFIDKREYLTKDTLIELIDKCINPIDQALFILLFEGVEGTKKSELCNLRKQDINFTNKTLNLFDDKRGNRILPVSDLCLSVLEKAKDQKKYFVNNGNGKKRHDYDIIETEYLFRLSDIGRGKIKKADRNRVDDFYFWRIINKIRDNFGLPKYFSSNYIKVSGILYFIKLCYEQIGKVDEKFALDEIYSRFDFHFQYYHRMLLKPEFISEYYELNFRTIDPFSLVDESEKETISSEVIKRDKQYQFSNQINKIYNNKCAITEEGTPEVLQSAHIQRYINEKSHHPQNGVLLRMDIHKLFDSHLITIDENYNILVSNSIKSTNYIQYHNKQVYLPKRSEFLPSQLALNEHRRIFFQKETLSGSDENRIHS